ncbi:MAG TPA: polysaccharide deacetylase family protein [Smithellaceae bacterium]|nr:polysaccharide deacetylase family protein [Smithellaceae bacterium]
MARKNISALIIIAFIVLSFVLAIPVHANVIEKLNIKSVALTFDACESSVPVYFEETILSYLIREKIPFTVFVTGKFARRNKERLREIAKLPFVEIENHSLSHYSHMELLPEEKLRREVMVADQLIKSITGRKAKYFRFPEGDCDEKSVERLERMHYKVVHWTFPSGDPDQNITPEKLKQWVVFKTKPGSILIFHINGRGYSTGEALPSIVTALRRKGFNFVKLEDGGL